jgi:glycerate dehydrogenase
MIPANPAARITDIEMKAVFLDFATMGAESLDPTPLFDVLPDLEIFASTAPDQVGERIRDAEYVLVNKVQIDAQCLAAADKLRYIGLTATGTDNIDLETAARRQVVVSNIRAYCTQSVVEHVFAALLTLAHNMHRFNNDVRDGAWQRAENFCLLSHPIRELSAMSIGIAGYGVLGRAVSKIAQAFGMHPLIARRRGAPAVSGDGRVDFDDMLAQSDVVTLHCPLDESTRQLIGAPELAAMKANSILINTARGGLVDSAALVDALANNAIAGAAIDVLVEEPPVSGDPLLDYRGQNLLLTPHIAWATVEARQNAICELAANIAAFQGGGERNRVV